MQSSDKSPGDKDAVHPRDEAMPEARDDEERQMNAYLLGQLGDTEADRLEERLLTDDAAFARFISLDDDLADAYVRGELAGLDRRRFAERLGASEGQRRRLEFARLLTAALDRRQGPRALAVDAHRQRQHAERRRAAWPIALAASLVLAAGFGWLGFETARSRPWSVTAERPPAALPVVAALALSPGLRSAENEAVLTLPPTPGLVELAVDLEGDDAYESFCASLARLDGGAGEAPLWSSDALRPRPTATGSEVVARVPTEQLAVGSYELTLEGRTTSGELTPIGFYSFTVIP